MLEKDQNCLLKFLYAIFIALSKAIISVGLSFFSKFRIVCFFITFLIIKIPFGTGQIIQKFENPIILDENKGLQVTNITSVVEDMNGFVWIGTNEGLYRYDGVDVDVDVFKKNPVDSNSLISNNIRDLYFDEQTNKIWISTWEINCGLSILNLDDFSFKNYYYNENKPGGVTGHSLFWTYKDKFEHYWVSTRGLSRYEERADTFRRVNFRIDENENSRIKFSHVNKVISYSEDVVNDSLVWLGTEGGLIKFNVVNEKYDHYPLVDFGGSGYTIRSLHCHTNNQIYIGTWSAGMYIFDPIKEKFRQVYFEDSKTKMGDSHTRIKKIFPLNDSILWIKTHEGLIEYNTDNNEASTILKNDLSKDKVYGVDYIDNMGRIYTWSNTDEKFTKLFIYTPDRQILKPIIKSIEQNFIPRRIIEDVSGESVWMVAQYSEGLYHLDVKKNKWTTIPPPENYFTDQNTTFQGWDMVKLSHDKFLVLEFNTIYEYTRNAKKLKPWKYQPSKYGVGYKSMILDQKGNLWIGTQNEGIYRIDPVTGTTRHYEDEMVDKYKWGTREIWDLQEDRNGNIWIRSNGYSVYDPRIDSFYNFAFFFPDEETVYHISAVGIDKNGDAWISTTSNGTKNTIGKTDADHPENGVEEYYSMDNFNSSQTNEFFLDSELNLWLISEDLERISDGGESNLFLSSDLLNNKDFSSATSLGNGLIAIGIRGGLGILDPDKINLTANKLIPYVQSIHIFDKTIDLGWLKSPTHPIVLQPDENFFEFEISALNPALFGHIEFQYQLTGVDPNWVTTANKSINYTDISSGKYNFKLRTREKSGKWSKEIYNLDLEILTPWYLSNWAYLVYFIILGIGTYTLYLFLLSKKLADQETLRLKELDNFKTRFYANITHEFRTPLTVIKGMTQDLKNHPDKIPDDNLQMIQRNCDKLLDLVNQMLDLSRIKANKVNLDYKKGDVVRYLNYLVESLSSYALLKEIDVEFKSSTPSLVMDFDPKILERVLINLITNAIKYTQNKGHVQISFEKIQEFIKINVTDDGIGIPENQLPFVFDRFHRTNSDATIEGTGLGLALVKEMVELMSGQIEIESTLNIGSTFSVTLPFRNKASTVPEINYATHLNNETHPNKLSLIHHHIKKDAPLVMLVEDNADVAFFIKTCLEEFYSLIHYSNGKEAFNAAVDTIPDLIISDVMMPEMNGFELAKKLKSDERTNHIPVILLTAKATMKDKLTGLSTGADAYLIKPFERDELLIRIKKLLEFRKKLQEKYRLSLSSDNGINAPDEKHPFILTVEKLIHDNLEDESLTITELAGQLFLSTSQVYRKIKAITGMSTAIFIRQVRLKRAKMFLTEADITISEVAYKTGFSSPAYFSQAFKETFGESPSDFQKQKQIN